MENAGTFTSNTTTIHHEVALTNNRAAELGRLQDHRNANFISIESYLAWMPPEEVMHIFQAIAALPSLRSFRISFSFQRFRQLPVLPIPSRALVSILDNNNSNQPSVLENLTLDEVTFSFRDSQDFRALAGGLHRAPRLKMVTLFNCFPLPPEHPDDNNDNNNNNDADTEMDSTIHSNPFDSLAHALTHIPNLQELNLIFTREGPEWIRALLQHVCSSRTMTILRINVPDFSFVGRPTQSLCRALQVNTTLLELSIRCPLDAQGGECLARALESSTSHCQLKQLYIQLKNYNFAIPIAEALHTNQHLTLFELRVWTGGDRHPLLSSLEQMVMRNLNLRRIIIDNGRLGLTPLIDFYLTLNLHDRRRLLQGGDKLTKQVWIDFLVRLRPNVSGLFYTLSLNPTLCERADHTARDNMLLIGNQGRQKRQRSF